MRQIVSEIQKGGQKYYTDEFDKSYQPQLQNEQILHSKIARYININPASYPYGKINLGKIFLKQDEDPWIHLRPQTTDQKARLNYQQEIQSILPKANPSTTKMRSHSLNNANYTKIKSLNLEKINKSNKNQKVIQANVKQNQEKILLIESAVYPQIYFSKTKLRHLLKQVNFPENAKVLEKDDMKIQVIYQIINKLFNEIPLFIFNVIICKRRDTNNYVIFFEDPEQIPFSKCCNAPIQVDLQESGVGMIVCNNPDCQANILVQFLISFDDAVKIWRHKQIFKQASVRDNQMRTRISSLISTGRYKHQSLKREIEKTSQKISEIFTNQEQYGIEQNENYEYDLHKKYNKRLQNNQNQSFSNNRFNDENVNTNANDMFMTNINHQAEDIKENPLSYQKDSLTYELDQIDKINADIQNQFTQNNELNRFKQQISEGLVQNSTIFNKKFYSYLTNQNNNQDLFGKTNSKVRMIRKPRLIQSSQIPKRQSLKPQQQQIQSLTFQNNFMFSQQENNLNSLN